MSAHSAPVQFGGLEGALRANTAGDGEVRSKNPMGGASLLSRALFLWVNPLMALGNRKVLQAEDLPQLQDADSAATLGMRLRHAWSQHTRMDRPQANVFFHVQGRPERLQKVFQDHTKCIFDYLFKNYC